MTYYCAEIFKLVPGGGMGHTMAWPDPWLS